ncbi:MAG: MMPL family transporter, partial [Phycisphaerales bacterium]|nr:MMPL family transporter [Phycisphaerales bacterium]
MRGLTPRLAHWSARRPVLVVAVATLALVAALLVLSRMKFEQSLSAMFGTSGEASAAMRRIASEYSTTDELLVLVTTSETSTPSAALVAFAERLEARLQEVAPDMVSSVRWTRHGIEQGYIENVMAPAAPFYLSDEGFETFLERLTPEGMRAQLRRCEQLMRTPGPGMSDLVSAIVRDPLRISELVDRTGTTMGEDADTALEVSHDGRTLLIRISGTRKVDDLEFSKRFTDLVGRTASEIADGEEIELAGGYAIASVTGRGIRGDAIRSVLIDVALLHLIFFVAFRRVTAPIAIAAVTGSGLVMGFAIIGLQGMTLTPLAATVAAILAGLGIDYGIHFLSHYDAARGRGLDPLDAAEETMSSIAFALGTCFLTTSCGFVSLLLSNVMMLRQFAALAGAGLAGCVFAVIVLM